jgi:hypothetical protein
MKDINWNELIEKKVRILHNQIASLKIWINENNGDDVLFNSMVAPYYSLLESIYEEEFPISNVIENSDLVLKLEGINLNTSNPRLSLISTVFNNVRRQVTNVTKAFAEISDIKKSLPKELDLGLSAVAKGSVILGFTIPSEEIIDKNNQMSMLGKEDPLYKATREAIKTLGVISKFAAEDSNFDLIEEEISDPKIRDTALVALKNISPSGRTEVERVGVMGRNFSENKINYLTSTSRKNLKNILKEPVKSSEIETYKGIVREIDLDAGRFDLRRISGAEIEDIRCIYPKEFEKVASSSLNKKMKVKGRIARSSSGKPRLLMVENLIT